MPSSSIPNLLIYSTVFFSLAWPCNMKRQVKTIMCSDLIYLQRNSKYADDQNTDPDLLTNYLCTYVLSCSIK